jgi:hypothetical protein
VPSGFELEEVLGDIARSTGEEVELGDLSGFEPEVDVETPALAFDSCKAVSEQFVTWACGRGLQAEMVQLAGSPDFADALPEWWLVPADMRLHYVVRVGSVYVDWTARQFDPEAPVPLVTTSHGWRNEYEATMDPR